MAAYSQTWKQSEQACFNYLTRILDSTEGKDAFVGATPQGMVNVWSFGFDGGPESPLSKSPGAYSVSAWQIDGIWQAYYDTRDKAIEALGVIMDNLPAGANHGARDIDYVQTMQVQRPANVASQWVELANSNQAHLITAITMQLTIVTKCTE